MKRSWPLFAVLAVLGLAQGGLPYPEGYRFWTHVKSMELKPGHPLYESFGGLHHIYVNPTGLRTYLEGKKAPFPKGTVIVFDLLEAKASWRKTPGATPTRAGGATTPSAPTRSPSP